MDSNSAGAREDRDVDEGVLCGFFGGKWGHIRSSCGLMSTRNVNVIPQIT